VSQNEAKGHKAVQRGSRIERRYIAASCDADFGTPEACRHNGAPQASGERQDRQFEEDTLHPTHGGVHHSRLCRRASVLLQATSAPVAESEKSRPDA
jgi:hypothetical protein